MTSKAYSSMEDSVQTSSRICRNRLHMESKRLHCSLGSTWNGTSYRSSHLKVVGIGNSCLLQIHQKCHLCLTS